MSNMASTGLTNPAQPMSDLWQNRASEIFKRRFDDDKYRHLVERADQECVKSVRHGAGTASKLALTMATNKLKKLVKNRSTLCRHHGVGAVGYAVVKPDEGVPPNDFFEPDRKFRIRFRHSNVCCTDDAGSCIREAAIKFADQNCEGPLDLILLTGQTALARNIQTLSKILKLVQPNDVRKMCESDPYFYISLVDGLRRAPSSFAELTYYSQIAYLMTTKDNKQLAVRFRLVPIRNGMLNETNYSDTGVLQEKDQEKPWETERRPDEQRDQNYLRQEFIDRLRKDEPVTYQLQLQTRDDVENPLTWHPQQIWNSPWKNVAILQLTTFIPCRALCNTYFNIVEKPRCLSFPAAVSATDPRSLQHGWSALYNKYEDNRISQLTDDVSHAAGSIRKSYIVTLFTAALKENGSVPAVDVYITLSGTDCRSTPQHLVDRVEGSNTIALHHETETNHNVEQFELEIDEDIGQLVAVIVSVRHRQLTEQWYLERVHVSYREGNELRERWFPCFSIVLSRVTLRPGEACLAEKQQFEVHRQERQFELCERRHQYQWAIDNSFRPSLPAQIFGSVVKKLPEMERLLAAKFTGLRWDIDPAAIEYFRYLMYDIVDGSKRQHLGPVPQRSFGGKLFDRRTLSKVKSPASVQEAKLRTLLRQYSVNITARVTAPTTVEVVDKQSPAQAPDQTTSGVNKARARWKKVKNVIKFTSHWNLSVILPEGAKGDMCRAVQSDVDFGRIFLCGPNPVMLRRCTSIPYDKLPVSNNLLKTLLHRSKNLEEEARNGYIYLVDYSLLHGIQTVEKDADRRYVAAPLVLLYVRANKDLVPLAIQLGPVPGEKNPVLTPLDRPQNWMLAKLWVHNADFQWQFAISHLFRCHWLMEPFVIATMRQMSLAHPVYKLLKPYFRHTLVTNTLLRTNLFDKFGPLNRYTSLGADGFNELIHRYWSSPDSFRFSSLNPETDLRERGADDDSKLPHYFYRDDALRLWKAIKKAVKKLLRLFYLTCDDITNDIELKNWLDELYKTGFAERDDFPSTVNSVDDLVDLVSCVIFTLTAQHSATHFDALDLYGFIPDVPTLMQKPVPNCREITVTRDLLSATLPDQFPDAYYVSLAFVMQVHKPDENVLGMTNEIYFVEPDAIQILDDFHKSMSDISRAIQARNEIFGVKYENLIPALIPASAEPIPYIPAETIAEAVKNGPKLSRDVFVKMAATAAIMIAPVELMSLPVCMHFATTLGGRSFIGRRMVSPVTAVNQTFGVNRHLQARTRQISESGCDEVDYKSSTDDRRKQFARSRRLESYS